MYYATPSPLCARNEFCLMVNRRFHFPPSRIIPQTQRHHRQRLTYRYNCTDAILNENNGPIRTRTSDNPTWPCNGAFQTSILLKNSVSEVVCVDWGQSGTIPKRTGASCAFSDTRGPFWMHFLRDSIFECRRRIKRVGGGVFAPLCSTNRSIVYYCALCTSNSLICIRIIITVHGGLPASA